MSTSQSGFGHPKIVHKTARFEDRKLVAICKVVTSARKSRLAHRPLLTSNWENVTCRDCQTARFNGVKDGIKND